MQHDLANTKISTLLWYYSIPALLGTLSNALFNIVDRIFISQIVGPLAISGLTLTFPIMNIIGATGMLVGQGAATRVSILNGQGNNDKVKQLIFNAFVLSLVIFIVVSLIFIFSMKDILLFFGGSYKTIPFAQKYLYIIIPCHIFTSLMYMGCNLLRANGKPLNAMLPLIIAAVMNIILDPIFIYILRMGIEGAAIATVISMFAGAVYAICALLGKDSNITISAKDMRIDIRAIGAILTIGLSPFLLQIGSSLVNMIFNQALLLFGGDLAVGAFGIITTFTALITLTISGISQGMQPIIGYNWGAGNISRTKKCLVTAILISTLITTIGCVICISAPQYIIRCFTADSQLYSIATDGLFIYGSLFFMVGFQIITTAYFQYIGKAGISILLSVSRQILFLIPFILILPRYYGLNGVWLAQPLSTLVATTLCGIVLIYFWPKRLNVNKEM